VTGRALDENTILAENNLPGPPQEKGSAPSEEKEAISLEKIPVAGKNLGLILAGTVLTDDPNMNIAFIYSRSTRQQEPYQKGDRIGEFSVKRILLDKVVIETESGEEVLVDRPQVVADRQILLALILKTLVHLHSQISGPLCLPDLFRGGSSSARIATADDGNAAVRSGSSTLGGGTAATDSGGALRSSRSSSENSSSSSSQGEDGGTAPPNTEPTLSSGPLW
jgi:hypothetical protein